MNRPLRNDAAHLDAVAAAYIQMVKDGERPSPRAIHERLGRRESYSAVEHNLRTWQAALGQQAAAAAGTTGQLDAREETWRQSSHRGLICGYRKYPYKNEGGRSPLFFCLEGHFS